MPPATQPEGLSRGSWHAPGRALACSCSHLLAMCREGPLGGHATTGHRQGLHANAEGAGEGMQPQGGGRGSQLAPRRVQMGSQTVSVILSCGVVPHTFRCEILTPSCGSSHATHARRQSFGAQRAAAAVWLPRTSPSRGWPQRWQRCLLAQRRTRGFIVFLRQPLMHREL